MDRTDVPLYIGVFVQLVNLNNISFNDLKGRVVAWNDQKERFQVLLYKNGKSIWVKPANLWQPGEVYDDTTEKKFLEFSHSKAFHKIDVGKKLLSKMNDLETNKIHISLRITWLKRVLLDGPQKKKQFKQIKSMINELIEICTFPDLLVDLKMIWVRVLDRLKEATFIDNLSILEECFKNHYGRIIEVGEMIIDAKSLLFEDNDKEYVLHIYKKVKNAMDKKLYKTIRKNECCCFFIGCLQAFGLISSSTLRESDDYYKIVDEIRYMIEYCESRLHDFYPEDRPQMCFAYARIAFEDKKYKQAIKYADIFHAWFAKTIGSDAPFVMGFYLFKMECFIYLKNKKLAKKNYQRGIRYAGHRKLPPFMEMINQFKDKKEEDSEDDKSYRVRPLEKCSNPFCNKIESTEIELKRCSKCLITRYCSKKCQKQHWKHEHKQYCEKLWSKKKCKA